MVTERGNVIHGQAIRANHRGGIIANRPDEKRGFIARIALHEEKS
jgi:hypothetical protein